MSTYHDYVRLFNLNSYSHTFDEFLATQTDFTIEEGKSFLEKFSKCQCCKRHQTNRPCKVEEHTYIEPTDYKVTYCECECRHASRIVCRAIKAMEPKTEETEMEPHDATLVIG